MAKENFEACLAEVLRHEGGYADHPKDPGGATKLGVTRATLARWRGRPVSRAEVKALTRAEAAAIYRALYWDEVKGDALPPGVDLCVFDHAVHAGPARAARALQAALGVPQGGRIGPQTLGALGGRNRPALIGALVRRRLSHLEQLRTFSVFGRGWRRRLAAVERTALAQTGAKPVAQEKDMLQDTKTVFASRTVWGSLVAIGAQLLSVAGFPLSADAQSAAVELIVQLAGIVGAATALWGRLAATRKIG